MAAAAIIFFAFYGFDAIATAAEETKNPGRDLTIGIVGSMFVCVIIYMAVAARRDRRARLYPLRQQPRAAGADPARDRPAAAPPIISRVSAVIALPTVILAFFYGQSRIFFVMARDGLLPREPGAGLGPRLAGPDHDLHRDRRRGRSPASSRSPSSPRSPMPARSPPSSRSASACWSCAGARPTRRARSARRCAWPVGIFGDPRLPLPALQPAAARPRSGSSARRSSGSSSICSTAPGAASPGREAA